MNTNTIERVEYGLDCTDLIGDEDGDCRESFRPQKSRFKKYENGKLKTRASEAEAQKDWHSWTQKAKSRDGF